MKARILVILGLVGVASALMLTKVVANNNFIITGAGATFPYPLYAKWAEAYRAETGVKLNYQAIGSGGGIKQIQARTVDFGASDKPLSSAELKQDGLVQFPTVMGAVVPVINLPGIKSGEIKLTGQALAEIYLGKITQWNDPRIVALNPRVKLPVQAITCVYRSDASGTTYLFTDYLAKVSSIWKTHVGADTAVAWAVGIGGKGNEGVTSYVKRVKGSIGYVEYTYAKQNKLIYLTLQNKSGHFVEPAPNHFKAAAENAYWHPATDFAPNLTDAAGINSWPIVGTTFILVNKVQNNPAKALAVLKFFTWSYQHGQQMALDLDYIPLPEPVIGLVKEQWKTHIKDINGKAIWANNVLS